MGRPLIVHHFILDHRYGGPHAYYTELLRFMSPSVVGVLFTTDKGPVTDVALLHLRRWSRYLYLLEVPANALILVLRYVTGRRPALLHIHGATNIAPLLAAVIARVPVVWQLHETAGVPAALVRLARRMLAFVDHRVIAVAKSCKQLVPGLGFAYAPGMVDTDFWSRFESPRPPPAVKPFTLVVVANLNPLKGVDIAVEALAGVEGRVALRIIGATLASQRQFGIVVSNAIRRVTSRSGGTVSVICLGPLDRTGVRSELAGADAFLLPSRSEASPIALLEAMSMGLACVATDVGDVREILPSEQHELICPSEDPLGLAAGIERARALGESGRARLGALNRARVEALFAGRRVSAVILEQYRALVPGFKP